jgi:hypothetical protein
MGRGAGDGGITAGRTAPDKIFIPTGKTAFWTADGSEEPPAPGAAFRRHSYFGTAVIAKKTGFLAHYLSAPGKSETEVSEQAC